MKNTLLAITGCLLLAACGTQPVTPSAGHIKDEPRAAGNIPKPVQQAALLPPPKPALKAETYSVVVNNVPVQELLFALARDARVNVDVHPGIEGNITLNALNQTLPQLLTRIAKQVDMRYELDGPNLVVMPDAPFLRNYKVDYLNMSREATSNVSIATQIATAGLAPGLAVAGRRHGQQQFHHLRHQQIQQPLLGYPGAKYQGHPAGNRQSPSRRLFRNHHGTSRQPNHYRHRLPTTRDCPQKHRHLIHRLKPQPCRTDERRHHHRAPHHLPRGRIGHRQPGKRPSQRTRHRPPA